MKVELQNKVALVTGGAGFIGRSICEVLAGNGATVFVQDYNIEAAQKEADLLKEKGYKAYAAGGDLTDIEATEQMTETVFSHFGKIDILVNNAGINTGKEDRNTIDSYNDSAWKAVLSVDLNGAYACSKHVSKYMVQAGCGRIINIGSVAGVVALRKQCAFVAAKSGLFGLTRAMAAELGQYGIQVNAIAPGSITNADWSKVAGDEAAQSLLSHIPLGRQGRAEDVASAVAFLAAPEASYITGALLTVDGGWTCGFMRDW